MVRERTNDRTHRSRLGLLGPLAGAAVIALLMALTPVAGAAHPNTTLLAPYVSTHAVSTKSSNAVCGTAAGAGAKWMPNSGTVTGASKSSVRSCPYIAQFAQGSSTRSEAITVPISLPFQGEYNTSMAFSYKLNPSMSLTTGTCPAAVNYTSGYDYEDCYYEIGWWVQVSLQIYDQTSGAYVSTTASDWYAENYTSAYYYNSCVYGTCSASAYSYTGSSAYDGGYEAPGYDYSYVYLSNGLSTGIGSVWSNSTNWNPVYSSGTNNTLLLGDAYVLVATFSLYSYADLFGYHDYYTGATSGLVDFNPPGSGSASVSASGIGHDLKVTSMDYNLI